MTNTPIESTFNSMAGAFFVMVLEEGNFNDERGEWAKAYREHAAAIASDKEYSLEDTNDAIEMLLPACNDVTRDFVRSTLIEDY